MRLSFRKQAKGRHALGAAVTALPSAPPRPAPVRAPVPVSSESWSTPVEAVAVVTPPAPPAPVAAVPPSVPPQPLPSLPVQPLDLHPVLLELAGPACAPPAMAPPVPVLPAGRPTAPGGPRIELGFADGTSRTLDPASEQAAALTALADQLNRRQ